MDNKIAQSECVCVCVPEREMCNFSSAKSQKTIHYIAKRFMVHACMHGRAYV